MTARLPTPSGCTHCGADQRSHYRRWTQTAGWHAWTPPTQAQIKARMTARREAHTATEK